MINVAFICFQQLVPLPQQSQERAAVQVEHEVGICFLLRLAEIVRRLNSNRLIVCFAFFIMSISYV